MRNNSTKKIPWHLFQMSKWKQLIFLAKIAFKKQIEFSNYFTSSQDRFLWYSAQMMKTVSFLSLINQKTAEFLCVSIKLLCFSFLWIAPLLLKVLLSSNIGSWKKELEQKWRYPDTVHWKLLESSKTDKCSLGKH